MAKRQYHYISALYNIVENGEKKTMSTTFMCSTDESNPSGIPTMGFMVGNARKWAIDHNVEYVENSFYIISIIKLTKAQFDQLNDNEEPKTEG